MLEEVLMQSSAIVAVEFAARVPNQPGRLGANAGGRSWIGQNPGARQHQQLSTLQLTHDPGAGGHALLQPRELHEVSSGKHNPSAMTMSSEAAAVGIAGE